MTRRKRIAVEVFGPPVIAAVLLQVYVLMGTLDLLALKLVPVVLFFAFTLAGPQSLAFAFVMEFAFARGLAAASWRTVLLAAALGTLSGVPVDVFWLDPRRAAPFFTVLGLVTGCAVGVVIRAAAVKARPH
jgi:hypothetical protein